MASWQTPPAGRNSGLCKQTILGALSLPPCSPGWCFDFCRAGVLMATSELWGGSANAPMHFIEDFIELLLLSQARAKMCLLSRSSKLRGGRQVNPDAL